MSHTPTPWSIFKQPIKGADDAKHELSEQVDFTDPISDTLFLLEAGGKCPATTGCGPTSEANAAFIVKACNAHEALVTALSSVLSAWDTLPPGLYTDTEMTEWINSPNMKSAISDARTALALTSAQRHGGDQQS